MFFLVLFCNSSIDSPSTREDVDNRINYSPKNVDDVSIETHVENLIEDDDDGDDKSDASFMNSVSSKEDED